MAERMKRVSYLLYLTLFITLFISPWHSLNQNVMTAAQEEKVFGKAALIFGTRVKDNKISPLLKERLEMGIRLYEGDKTKTLILSNTAQAAFVMKDYMIGRGIPDKDIILDIEAEITRHSCQTAIAEKNSGSILFVSQAFHLPRIYYECLKSGVEGQLVPAEFSNTIDRSKTSLYQILTIRFPRYVREMSLLWHDIVFQKIIF